MKRIISLQDLNAYTSVLWSGAAIISMVQDQLRLNIPELASINLKLSGVIKTDLGRLGAQVVSGIG